MLRIAKIAAPAYVLIEEEIDIETACTQLQFPLFVKPQSRR
jgi:D-alanine-D-alanine ligase-like ATP-grasp enzyme